MHPDERKWAQRNAQNFAQFYKDQTGKDLTPEQAQNMLLANGYRIVDAVASKGPGGDPVAIAYISHNAGNLFSATTAQYNNPFLNGNPDGSLTPEQRALPGAVANPAAGLAVAGAIATAGVGPEVALPLRPLLAHVRPIPYCARIRWALPRARSRQVVRCRRVQGQQWRQQLLQSSIISIGMGHRLK